MVGLLGVAAALAGTAAGPRPRWRRRCRAPSWIRGPMSCQISAHTSAAGPAQRPGVLGLQGVAPVGVVVEERQLLAPRRPHGEAGGQQDPDGVAQGRRPGARAARAASAPSPGRPSPGRARRRSRRAGRPRPMRRRPLPHRDPCVPTVGTLPDAPGCPRSGWAGCRSRPARIVGRRRPTAGATHPGVELATSLPAFLLAVLLISASPGPAMALIFRRAALRGLAGAVPTVLGLELGLYCWALFAGAGFAALVAASEIAYLVLRVVGAARAALPRRSGAFRAAWLARQDPRAAAPPGSRRSAPLVGLVRRGRGRAAGQPEGRGLHDRVLSAVRAGRRPGLRDDGAARLLQITVETALYLGLAAGVARAGAWFRRPRIRRRLEVVSGTVLVGLGLRVAVEQPVTSVPRASPPGRAPDRRRPPRRRPERRTAGRTRRRPA